MANEMPSEPGVKQLMDSFIEGGWDAFDPQKQQAAAVKAQELSREEQLELANAIYRTFQTVDGKRTLEYLLDQTLRRASWNGTFDMLKVVPYGLYREGQNSIVAIIIQHMQMALDGGDPVPTKKGPSRKRRSAE